MITGENAPNFHYIDEDTFADLTDVIDIAAGYGQTLCLLEDGTVKAFGFDDAGKRENVNTWGKSQTIDAIINNSQWVDR